MQYECKQCNKSYKSKNQLENHFKSKQHLNKCYGVKKENLKKIIKLENKKSSEIKVC